MLIRGKRDKRAPMQISKAKEQKLFSDDSHIRFCLFQFSRLIEVEEPANMCLVKEGRLATYGREEQQANGRTKGLTRKRLCQ